MINGSDKRLRGFGEIGERVLPVLVLFIVAYGLYNNTFGHQWTYDDFPVIVENPDVRSLANFLRDTYPGRPLREMTFLVDYALFGMKPAGWHFQQIFWHGLNGILLWCLVQRLGGGRIAAWTASLLFIVHPLQVEVVANISHRKDSLALAFCFMAMLAYIRFFSMGKCWRWLVMATLLYLVAYQSKQNAVLLPIGFLAYEYLYVEKAQRFLLVKSRLLKFIAVGTGVGSLLFFLLKGRQLLQQKIEPFLVEMNQFPPFHVTDYFQMVFKGWSFMARRIVWPTDLAPEYVFAAPSSWLDPWILLSALMVALVMAGLYWGRNHSALTFFAIVWFVIFFLPISNLWPLTYFAADRYYYAPLSGGCILAGLLTLKLYRQKKKLTALGVTALMFFLVFASFRQSQIWQSPLTLWSHSVTVNPESSTALNNMGRVYSSRGDDRQALRWYLKAAKVNSSRPMPRHNLGWTYERLGNRSLALYYFRQFLERIPYSSNPVHRQAAEKVREHLQTEYGVRY